MTAKVSADIPRKPDFKKGVTNIATKDEERKALEQIQKIVSNLGADSYIGFAFDGCFELALDNIENDFASSYKAKAENEAKKKAELLGLNAELEKEVELYKGLTDETAKKAETLNAKILELDSKAKNLESDLISTVADLEDARIALAEKDTEIMTLKAKLYDCMTK